MEFLKPLGDEIIRLLQPRSDDFVLDVAAGTGEPGLTIAAMLGNGKVIVTDIAEGMLEIARESAARRGLDNLETQLCDVCELPFADSTFDAISCRLGFMFFPDMQLAAKEMARVLKPGGKIATAVWNVPEKNFWVTAIGGTINKNMQLQPPTGDEPGIFRCAERGFIANIFHKAGLTNISEYEVTGKLDVGSTDVYWTLMTDVAAPFVAALSKADNAMKETIKTEVYELVNQKFPNGNTKFDSSALVIYGEKR